MTSGTETTTFSAVPLACATRDAETAREQLWRAAADPARRPDALITLAQFVDEQAAPSFISYYHSLAPADQQREDVRYAAGLAAFRGRMWRRAMTLFAPLAARHAAARTALESCIVGMTLEASRTGRAVSALTALLDAAPHLPPSTATSLGLRLLAVLGRSDERDCVPWFLHQLLLRGVNGSRVRIAAALATPGVELEKLIASDDGTAASDSGTRGTIELAIGARRALAGKRDAVPRLLEHSPIGTPGGVLRELCRFLEGERGALPIAGQSDEWRAVARSCQTWSPALLKALPVALEGLPAEQRAVHHLRSGAHAESERTLRDLAAERPEDLRSVHGRAILAVEHAAESSGAGSVSAWTDFIPLFGLLSGHPTYLRDWVRARLDVYGMTDEDADLREAALVDDIEQIVFARLTAARDQAHALGARADYGRFDKLRVDFRREALAARTLRSRSLEWGGTRLFGGPMAIAQLGTGPRLSDALDRLDDGDPHVIALRRLFSWLGRPLARASLGDHLEAFEDLRRLLRAAAGRSAPPPGFSAENHGYGRSGRGFRRYLRDLRALLSEELLAAFQVTLMEAASRQHDAIAIEGVVSQFVCAAREHGCDGAVLSQVADCVAAYAEQVGNLGSIDSAGRAIRALESARRCGLEGRALGSLLKWRTRRASLLQANGDLAGAEEDLRESLDIDGGSISALSGLVDLLFLRARSHLDLWDFALARRVLDVAQSAVARARTASGERVSVQTLLADLVRMRGRVDEEEALARESGADEALARAAELVGTDRVEDAVRLLENARHLYPNEPRIVDRLASATAEARRAKMASGNGDPAR